MNRRSTLPVPSGMTLREHPRVSLEAHPSLPIVHVAGVVPGPVIFPVGGTAPAVLRMSVTRRWHLVALPAASLPGTHTALTSTGLSLAAILVMSVLVLCIASGA